MRDVTRVQIGIFIKSDQKMLGLCEIAIMKICFDEFVYARLRVVFKLRLYALVYEIVENNKLIFELGTISFDGKTYLKEYIKRSIINFIYTTFNNVIEKIRISVHILLGAKMFSIQ